MKTGNSIRRNLFLALLVTVLGAQSSGIQAFSQMFADVAERANPAVVTILADKMVRMDRFHRNTPFERFFNREFLPPQGDREFRTQTLGSGVIVGPDKGYILTNNHVVADVDKINVRLIDKREFKATIIGRDPKSDLAVLQIDAANLSGLSLGDSDQLRVGEWVLAVGSPFSANLSHSVTAGIVSALGRSNIMLTSSGDSYEDFIQTDAAINPGNSGGALLNLKGELVGINTAIATGGFERANRGVGFAIPSNMARRVMRDLIEKGYVVRAWLGVYIQEVDDVTARGLDMETRDGALVGDVVDGSPAKRAGLKIGDVIVEFNGTPVKGPSNLRNLVSSSPPGLRAPVRIIRKGREKTITVVLDELPTEEETLARRPEEDNSLGLQVEDVSRTLINKFGLERGIEGVVVTAVRPNSAAERSGIRLGDVITRVGDEEVASVKDFKSLVKTTRKRNSLLVLIKRNNISRFFALDLGG